MEKHITRKALVAGMGVVAAMHVPHAPQFCAMPGISECASVHEYQVFNDNPDPQHNDMPAGNNIMQTSGTSTANGIRATLNATEDDDVLAASATVHPV